MQMQNRSSTPGFTHTNTERYETLITAPQDTWISVNNSTAKIQLFKLSRYL